MISRGMMMVSNALLVLQRETPYYFQLLPGDTLSGLMLHVFLDIEEDEVISCMVEIPEYLVDLKDPDIVHHIEATFYTAREFIQQKLQSRLDNP
ncbi:MAG: hypothetical protein COA78_24795 [Blastopirellula sp.]|nr:MAG: hypothetical protein COA78_24795 [Blastopirellula sp.]